jgi:ABC-type transport system involved in multi-copper enzyme maturation permease subunit
MKFLAVVQREFQENMRNYKFIFLVMFIFGGILMALYTEVGPTANSKNVLNPFFELFAVLCPLIGIFAAMDSVVGEKEKGTLELVLSKPISRSNLLFGKFAAYVLVIVPLLVAELVIAYFWAQHSGISTQRWHLPMPSFGQWMSMVGIVTMVSMCFVALTILISLFARSTATAALMGIVFMFPAHPLGGAFLTGFGKAVGITDFEQVPVLIRPVLSVFSKYQNFALESPLDAWICIISLLLLTIFLLFLSGQIFNRQNITFRM